MNHKQSAALDWLRRPDKQRMIYEGAAASYARNRGGPSGEFYIDYSDGTAPVLSRADVSELARLGYIERKWPDCEVYRLAHQSSKPL